MEKVYKYYEVTVYEGNRTIAPRIITLRTVAPQDNCLPDNCPPKIAIPEIVPQIISPWTILALTTAPQNNRLLICTPE